MTNLTEKLARYLFVTQGPNPRPFEAIANMRSAATNRVWQDIMRCVRDFPDSSLQELEHRYWSLADGYPFTIAPSGPVSKQ